MSFSRGIKQEEAVKPWEGTPNPPEAGGARAAVVPRGGVGLLVGGAVLRQASEKGGSFGMGMGLWALDLASLQRWPSLEHCSFWPLPSQTATRASLLEHSSAMPG